MAEQRRSPDESDGAENGAGTSKELGRRRFLGYLLAAPTLAVGVQMLAPSTANAAIPSPPQPENLFDLGDLQNLAAAPTAGLISVQVNADGTASFAAHRAEVGQGMTTAVAMMIAEEMDLPMSMVTVTLADARPELLLNQLTGGSNSMRSIYLPVRTAAAIARQQLVLAAAARWNVSAATLSTANGVVTHPSGLSATYGSLAAAASASVTTQIAVPQLKSPSQFTILGTSQGRIDAHDIVTGRKTFGMDIQVPNALPTMVARPPTINGTVVSVNNADVVAKMPGVTDIATLTHGVAIRAATFGQCIDAIQELSVTWGPGTVDGQSDQTVLAALKAAEIPLVVPPLGSLSVDASFTFAFASNAPLETDNAIADVRADSAEIWSSLKVPIDAAREAAEISKAMGKPVKLMWSRTDDFRQGRTHPMCVSRVRATYLLGNVLTYEQRHTSVQTDFSHGLGEAITATAASLPIAGNLSFAETIFELSQSSPYNFGVTTQLLNEVPLAFNTGSMRNIYSPNVVCAQELVVDQLAAKMGMDPVAFRRAFLKDSRLLAVLNEAAQVGGWGASLPSGIAQGIGLHSEYGAAIAALVEIDCTPATVNRQIPNAVTGPRVTKALVVVDPGFAINPLGLEAQMIGGVNDGIALALTSSLHMQNGIPLEGSWDNYFYTREWNTPLDIQVVVMPNTSTSPSGAGELAVAPVFAAVACAYARATGTMPTYFPINHNAANLGFTPYPLQPSTPQSRTDGLTDTY